ncbi:DUF6571 family protein [Actinomyces capricornis]|uniref:DUF6571 domain-containing protein n=1 Tax=Actinomyces capricornis TaxID=2755559 RepID=A0ABM7U6P9_9ACTO|nr:DUF6571 family protein [Actinomyces capricornis]BDA63225.1 hypothetical protein MANAM107_00590 [Actinomyces capricornis]
MAFIQIDINGMMTVINNLTERATAINAQRKNIRDSSTENHDPVPSVVDATIAYPAFLTPGPGSGTLSGCANELLNIADQLRTRRQEAIDLNSSGITTSDSSGIVSYYLPDPPEGTVDTEAYWNDMDTVTNVKSYNSESVKNAQAESAELQEALDSGDGKSSKGRDINEIMAEIAKHQDIPTYGAAFVTTWTPEAYLDLSERISNKQRELGNESKRPYNGGILGGLEQENNSNPNATSMLGHLLASYSQSQNGAEALDKSNAFTEAAIASGHQRLGELNRLLSTPDAYYDDNFILRLAERLEEEPIITDDDPLAGVMSAMGNRPEAAVNYFMPDWEPPGIHTDPSPAAVARWELLNNREWGASGIDGLSRALAGASSLRPPSDSTIDDRATWVTAKGLTLLAENTDSIQWNSTEHNIGILLGNCGPEVTGIATRSQIIPGDEEPYKTAPITINGGESSTIENSVARLLHEVSDSSDANYEIAKGTTAYAAARSSARNGLGAATIDEIKATYDDQAEVINLLTSLNNSENSSSIYDGAMAATSILGAVPSPHISFPATVVNTGLSTVRSSAPDATGHHDNSALLGAAYTNALNSGLVNNIPDPEENPWCSVNENGGYEITLETEEQIKSFYSWIKDNDGSDAELISTLNEIGTEQETKPWTDEKEFKRAYGGEEW